MKTIFPDYFNQFHCIADRWQHSCCVGWEIDVDESAQKRYAAISGPLGDKLRASILLEETPHFQLTAAERCPFLNEQNLCELILALGEDALCQICADHPRFRNFFSDRVELGLGLCCEAAADLILSWPEPVRLQAHSDDAPESPLEPLEQAILTVRSRAFEILQNRDFSICERIQQLLLEFDVRLPVKSDLEWAELFLSLERLDEEWTKRLTALRNAPTSMQELSQLEIPLEQLAVYFVYRHLPAAQDAEDLRAYLAFAALSWQLIRRLCQAGPSNDSQLEELCELARLYSSEIEYSEENTQALLELLWNENA